MGFTFDRLGVRLPAIAISPWIDEHTVVNDVYHHTSVIRTLRERWNLGARSPRATPTPPTSRRSSPSTNRDRRGLARRHPQPVPEFDEALIPPDTPLSPLAKAFIAGYLALAKQLSQRARHKNTPT